MAIEAEASLGAMLSSATFKSYIRLIRATDVLTGTINEQCTYIKLQKLYNDTANFKHQHVIFAHVSAQAFFIEGMS